MTPPTGHGVGRKQHGRLPYGIQPAADQIKEVLGPNVPKLKLIHKIALTSIIIRLRTLKEKYIDHRVRNGRKAGVRFARQKEHPTQKELKDEEKQG